MKNLPPGLDAVFLLTGCTADLRRGLYNTPEYTLYILKFHQHLKKQDPDHDNTPGTRRRL